VVGDADADALRAWLAACAASAAEPKEEEQAGAPAAAPPAPPAPLLFGETADRALRGRVHALVRARLPWVESDAAGEGAAKSVRLRSAFKRRREDHRDNRGGGGGGRDGGRGGRGRGRGDNDAKRPRGGAAPPPSIIVTGADACRFDPRRNADHPDGDDDAGGADAAPRVLSFVLTKENTDTGAALAVLASLLRCGPRALGFAGTKDKRGVTTQRVTWQRGAAGRVAALNARLVGMRVGGCEMVHAPLGLGDLRGNAFTVTLRDVRGAQGGAEGGDDGPNDVAADVARALGGLRASGFVNYFGLQRFGAAAGARTHAVGAALARGDWAAAVALLLSPRAGERADMAAARAAWAERRDAAAALALLPMGAAAERAILSCFARAKSDANLVAALTAIPKTLRMMYVHAYQARARACASPRFSARFRTMSAF
jgi:tRNA pseudouridine13 synthase